MTRFLSLAAFVSLLPALPAASAPNPAGLTDYTHSGDQRALEQLDQEIRAARLDPARLAALETRLLETLGQRNATFAARQAAAQRLGWLLGRDDRELPPAAARTLASMLLEAHEADLARLALEPMPGAAADRLLVAALPDADPRAQFGILETLGRRRTASAVEPVRALLANAAPALQQAAARTLGAIATPEAWQALAAGPAELTAEARLEAASRMPPAEALRAWRELASATGVPPAIRLAAFRASLEHDLPTVPTRIRDALAGSDWSRKEVALEAVATSRAPNLTSTLAQALPRWDAPTQVAVLSALARRGEAEAVPAARQALQHPEAEVKAAAVAALGFLPGSPETADALAALAVDPASDHARAARQSLARLGGAGVSAHILERARTASPELRVVFLEQLALRNQTEGLPLLLGARQDPRAEVRIAAVGALGDLAPVGEQAALLDWTLQATDEAEQARALRSLVNVILRDPDTAGRGRVLFTALDQAAPETARRLLPALGRIGGAASAEAGARLALREEAQLGEAATAALARWTDASALPALATLTEKAQTPGVRDAARDGVLRYFERPREPWTPELTRTVQRVLAATKDSAARRQLVTILHRANDRAALTAVDRLRSDPELGAAARTAADVIRANLEGTPRVRASGHASGTGNLFDFKSSTRWSVPTEGDEWIEVDFRRARPLTRLTLDQTNRTGEYPERYEVFVTDDPARPGKAVVTGAGERTRTVIELPPNTRGRYVILRNTAGRKDGNWSIVELYVD